jgi:hypothetical protein
METIVALLTYSVVDAVMEPSCALTVVLPGVRALAKPLAPMLAATGSDEVHETLPVML